MSYPLVFFAGTSYSPNPANWIAALSKVPVLLNRTGFSLQQLYQLLEAIWVTQSGVTLQAGTTTVAGLQVLSPDTDDMIFTGLTADVLDRANRFLRLWTASGLQIWELDWALEEAPGGILNDAFLVFLSGAIAVQNQLSLPFQETLSFWMPLETRDVTNHLGDEDTITPSTYSEVFRNPAVLASAGSIFVPVGQSVITAASDAAPIAITTGSASRISDGPAGFHHWSAGKHRGKRYVHDRGYQFHIVHAEWSDGQRQLDEWGYGDGNTIRQSDHFPNSRLSHARAKRHHRLTGIERQQYLGDFGVHRRGRHLVAGHAQRAAAVPEALLGALARCLRLDPLDTTDEPDAFRRNAGRYAGILPPARGPAGYRVSRARSRLSDTQPVGKPEFAGFHSDTGNGGAAGDRRRDCQAPRPHGYTDHWRFQYRAD